MLVRINKQRISEEQHTSYLSGPCFTSWCLSSEIIQGSFQGINV